MWLCFCGVSVCVKVWTSQQNQVNLFCSDSSSHRFVSKEEQTSLIITSIPFERVEWNQVERVCRRRVGEIKVGGTIQRRYTKLQFMISPCTSWLETCIYLSSLVVIWEKLEKKLVYLHFSYSGIVVWHFLLLLCTKVFDPHSLDLINLQLSAERVAQMDTWLNKCHVINILAFGSMGACHVVNTFESSWINIQTKNM